MAKVFQAGNVMTMPGCHLRVDEVEAVEIVNSGRWSSACFLQITLASGAQVRTAHVTQDDAYDMALSIAQVMGGRDAN